MRRGSIRSAPHAANPTAFRSSVANADECPGQDREAGCSSVKDNESEWNNGAEEHCSDQHKRDRRREPTPRRREQSNERERCLHHGATTVARPETV